MAEQTRELQDRALFDRMAASYAQKDLHECSRVAREQRLRQTLNAAGVRPKHLLEVGCGAGFTARYLADSYETYTGVDYSSELIRYAEHYNRGPQRSFVCSNINGFSASRKFDVILMIGVLHHMPDPAETLARLRSLLAPEGVVIANEPQRGNPVISSLRWLRKRVDLKYSSDQVEFSEAEIEALFERSGYEVESVPQGIFSTPFAETRPLPEMMSLPMARLATAVDPALERLIGGPRARRLAWNVVVVGRPTGDH